ncbi:MAG: protein kinase [Anaerolineae bacterium]
MSDTLSGKTIGKYEIIEKIGRGGMAEVYKGYQKNLERYVAIKLMHTFLVTEQDFLNRFQREARAMAALNHPNIVGVYDFDLYQENTYYLVMEYIDGGTLKEKLETLARNHERLPLAESVRIGREVADALAYAHRRNMVHRDIKPANIMLDKETGRAILTDFGIVKLVGGQSVAYTATGALIGTPAYMSPEQALGKSGDERADIYSMGVLLFQMVTGQLPYEADTPLAVVMKHVNEPTPMPIVFNPDIPEALQNIILKAMAKVPEDRYQTAGELATALRQVDLTAAPAQTQAATAVAATKLAPTHDTPVTVPAATEPLEAEAAVSTPAAAPPKKRFPWLYAGIGFVLILAVVGAVWGLGRRNSSATPTVPVVAVVETDTATPEAATKVAPTTAPKDTPDVVATAIAAIALTEAAQPTHTAVPTNTPTPTKTPTPNATLDFLANCTTDVQLVKAYSYRTQSSSAAPVSVTFPMNWVLKNSGTCPWPAGSQWAYAEGDELGFKDAVTLENEVLADEEITLTTDLVAPDTVGQYESTWQLVDDDGQPIGPPLTFSVNTYVPATATPVPPAGPSPTPTANATTEITELNYAFEILNCEYVGDDWRCRVRLTPYGGGGGPYTMFIFLNPIVELRNQFSYDYFAQARRCAAWNTEIKVIDEATSLEFSRNLYIDPDNYIPGGCVKP